VHPWPSHEFGKEGSGGTGTGGTGTGSGSAAATCGNGGSCGGTAFYHCAIFGQVGSNSSSAGCADDVGTLAAKAVNGTEVNAGYLPKIFINTGANTDPAKEPTWWNGAAVFHRTFTMGNGAWTSKTTVTQGYANIIAYIFANYPRMTNQLLTTYIQPSDMNVWCAQDLTDTTGSGLQVFTNGTMMSLDEILCTPATSVTGSNFNCNYSKLTAAGRQCPGC